MAEDTAQSTANVEAEAPKEGAPELTVSDLHLLKQVIDVASQRGAFKPNEMVNVGTIYNKLEAFLGAVQSQQQQSPAEGE